MKDKILKNVRRISAEQCIKYIEDGAVTFAELQNTGDLQASKQKEIKAYFAENEAEDNCWRDAMARNTVAAYDEYLYDYPTGRYELEAKERIRNARENEAWNAAIAKNSVGGYENFITQFPESKHRTSAQLKIDELRNAGKAELGEWMRKLKENPEIYTIRYIEDLIDEGRFTKKDLVDYGLISSEKLDVLFDPPIMPDSYDWSDLAPLPKGKTDVYLFGVAGSGKSSMLAGVFYRADELGILIDDITNEKGTIYKDLLIESVDKGHVVPPTQNDTVNYISCSIVDEESDREHPLSVIEMSGEFFTNAYDEQNLESLQSVQGTPYLQNTNRKVIYFIVDYNEHVTSKKENQKAKMTFVLNLLDKDGTLAKTDSIHIIVTKTDLIKSSDRESHISDFLNTNFKNPINQIKRFNKKYGINKNQDHDVIVHPFTLGSFYLGKVYDFDPESSDEIIMSILNSTASNRRKKRKLW